MPVFCPKCHAMLADGTAKCPACGARLPKPTDGPLDASDIPWITAYILRLTLIPLLLVIIIAAVCLVVLLQ